MAKTKTPTKPSSDRIDRATDYARDVVEGREVAGPHVRNACRRHLDDLVTGHDRGLHWDLDQAEHIWRFYEGVFRLSEGQFEGLPFKLHPSQAFIVGCINGWRKTDGTRRFRRVYVEEGKGNGKSPLIGGLGLYGLTADGEAGAQIYAAAARKEQAAILFQDACKMVRQSPALSRKLVFSGGMGREYNVAHHGSQSFFRPISKEAGKTGSGPRPHFALCDEVHEHPDRTIMEMLERGFKFRRQPLLVMITNSGSDRNSVCWEEHQHAIRVAAGTRDPDDIFTYVGEPLDDTTFSYVCALDKGDDPLTDPSCWRKANPLLGVTITEEYLAGVVKQAVQLPGKMNGILRLHFCCWTDAETSWMARSTFEACLDDFDPEIDHAGAVVYAGADLSATQDITALAFVTQTGVVEVAREGGTTLLPTYDAWVEAFTPAGTIQQRGLQDQAPYDVWERDGWLTATPGNVIRMDHVAARVASAAQVYQMKALGFDAFAFRRYFEPELDAMGVTVPLLEHPQGGKKKAADSGMWMPGSLKELESLILEGRIRIQRNPVIISAVMSATTEADAFDNRWFSKRKATNRIDAVVALAMAVGVATSSAFDANLIYADARDLRFA